MKKITIIQITCLVIILVLTFGCDRRTKISVPTQFEDTILPLAEGNYWLFVDSTFVNGEPDSVFTKKMGITGATQISHQGDKKWVYHWTWFDMPEDKPQVRKSLVTNEPDGLVYYGQRMGASYTEFNRRMFIKYPAEEEEEWTYTQGAIVKCLSVSTPFETPSGVFNAHKYRMTLGEITQYLYYVPEVGYVGMEEVRNGQKVLSRRLTEYVVAVD